MAGTSVVSDAGVTLSDVLDELTQRFLDDENIGASGQGISAIFDFYYDDFEQVGGVETFIARYRSLDDVNVNRFLFNDWALNIAED